jgi:hypothetical protein
VPDGHADATTQRLDALAHALLEQALEIDAGPARACGVAKALRNSAM